MIARPATFIRCFESVMADTPIADRWDFLTAESEALEQQMTDALEAHRADCIRRYGFDWRRSDFTSGPPHPALAPENEQ